MSDTRVDKHFLDRYRLAAERLVPVGVRINPHGQVMCVDGGAFVETYIWVPESAVVVDEGTASGTSAHAGYLT